MRPGHIFTIEPLLVSGLGQVDYEAWDDGWTYVAKERRRSAQFEHTVLITQSSVEVLTRI